MTPRAWLFVLAGLVSLDGGTYMGGLASQRFGWNDLQVDAPINCYGVGTVIGGLAPGRLTPPLASGAWPHGGASLSSSASACSRSRCRGRAPRYSETAEGLTRTAA
ncbi:MAG TPA: hypothetical protein VMR23_13750 [Candidatus Limnocylindria bacterium]|nr:hypothetical protein [Candidatus Limnocylindria bacterium]